MLRIHIDIDIPMASHIFTRSESSRLHQILAGDETVSQFKDESYFMTYRSSMYHASSGMILCLIRASKLRLSLSLHTMPSANGQ